MSELERKFGKNTYYSSDIHKGILLDKNSIAFKQYFDGHHNNVKELMEKYKIDLFELEFDNNEFRIEKVN